VGALLNIELDVAFSNRDTVSFRVHVYTMPILVRIYRYLKKLPYQQSSRPRKMCVVHVSLQPRTWFGNFIVGLIGLAIILAMFFLSILAFTIVASIFVIVVIYVFWANHCARRATGNQTIDGVVKKRDI
jgi:hypothetical protein